MLSTAFRPMMLAALLLVGPVNAAFAQVKPAPPDLTLLSLEDLMNLEITSASRKEQRLGDVAAAVYVITQEDIRRSGMTTLPELFRLVPGMHVAQINSNKWAVAVRGFNNLFADKLLVMVDGRTAYDRLNSGVFWESLDLPLDQIERIEVIRGPGGATWGANAVNGVVNVITKRAGDTPGVSATVRAGTFDGTHGSVRYGGRFGNTAYRVFSQWAGREGSRLDSNASANDTWESQTHGFRLDRNRGSDDLTMQGGATLARLRGLWPAPSGPVRATAPFNEWGYTREYHLLGRWTHRGSNESSLDVQSFVNFRHNVDSVNPRQLMADVDAKYHTRIGKRHDVVVGGGYRVLEEATDGGFAFSISPAHLNEHIVNAFVQDEIALGQRVQVSLGTKVERDTFAGWGVQPTGRVMWSLVPRQQHVWGSVSRALRTPSLGDISGRYNYASFVGPGGLPIVVGALGNADYQNEEVVDAEAGYRVELGSTASIDVTAFVASYDKLKTNEPLAPQMELTPGPPHLFIPVQFQNLLQARTSGVEVSARWTPVNWWRFEGGYSTFHLTPHLSSASRDTEAATFDGNVPSAQWQLRSAFSIAPRTQFDAMLFYVGSVPTIEIERYTRADARLEVSLTRHLLASVAGQNLFDGQHAEFGGHGAIVNATRIPRNAYVQLRWAF